MATVLISNESSNTNRETLLFDSAAAAAAANKSPFRRIEFHAAKKTFTGFVNGGGGGGGGGFRLETLNPSSSNSSQERLPSSNQVNGPLPLAEKKKRDGLVNGVDPEVTFRITIRRIGAGLANLGNTCFLNSVLQCLTYTEPLAAYLQSGRHQLSCRCSGFCALCAMQKHVSRALQLTGQILAPKDLVSNLRCISRNFRNSRQEDAHEYMVNLLESMHKCCLPSGVPSESPSAYEKSLVHKIFGGRLRSQVKCMQCSFCSDKFDPFLDLSLEIVKADNVSKALANFTAKEQLDGGERQYQCQQCKQKVRALKQLTIHKAPYILTIHLKRFGSHMSGQKIDKKVHFAPTLDLKPFVTGPYEEDLKYTLYGVLVHAGWSTHSGHYYCFVRASSGLWYSLDDNKVVQVSEKKVFEQKAYMLFYSRDMKSHVSKKPVDVAQKEAIINGIQRNKTFPNSNGVGDGVRSSVIERNLNGFNSVSAAQSDKTSITTVASKGNRVKVTKEKEIGCSTSLSSPTKEPLFNNLSKVIAQDSLVNGLPVFHQNGKLTSTSKPNDAKNVLPTSNIVNGIGESKIMKVSSNSVVITSSGNFPGTSIKMADKNDEVKVPLDQNGNIISIPSSGNFSETSIKMADKNDKVKVPIDQDGNSSTNKNGSESAVATSCNVNPSVCVAEKTCSKEVEGFGPKLAGVGAADDGQRSVESELSVVLKTKCPLSQEKASGQKAGRKLKKKFLKCQVTSRHLSSNILIGSSLSVWKKKKHKRTKKCAKNLSQEHLMDLGPSSSERVKTVAIRSKKGDKMKSEKNSANISNDVISAKVVDKEFSDRTNKNGAELATVGGLEKNSGNALRGSLSTDNKGETISNDIRKDQTEIMLVNLLTRGLEETPIPKWDDVGSSSIQFKESRKKNLSIGYVGDEWDEDYDRGKRKKVRNTLDKFDGQNPFQEIATKKAKLDHAKLDQSRSGIRPFRK